MIAVAPHPLLELGALIVTLPRPLAACPSPPSLVDLLRLDAPSPLSRNEETRAAVRDLLRHGGFKPTGRSKPASEYLVRAAEEGALRPINLLADAGNAASLHGGLPISVVDLDALHPPLRVEVAPPGSEFVFNAAGQVVDVAGLLGLADAEGPCANAVKDSQRSKTAAATRRALCLVWGTKVAGGLTARTAAWLSELLQMAGADVKHL